MSGRAVPPPENWRRMETITPDEYCTIVRTSRFTVYRKLKSRTIPGFQIGDSWRIPVRWARAQLGEIQDEAYTRLEAEKTAEPEPAPEVAPPKRGRPRRRARAAHIAASLEPAKRAAQPATPADPDTADLDRELASQGMATTPAA